MRTNSTRPLHPLFGRDAALRDLRETLARGVRLLALVGPPGAGKTHLATALLSELQPSADLDFPGGMYLVADVDRPNQLCAALSKHAELSQASCEVPGALDRVGAKLSERGATLLFIDDVDRIDAASEILAALEQSSPNLQIVFTTRRRLNVGEHVYEVTPLSLARSAGAASDAACYFVFRAKADRIGWEPSDAEMEQIESICDLVDGLPLSIELAASLFHVLGVETLRERLERSLDIIEPVGGGAAAPLRQSMAVALEGLAPEERSALARLTLFTGGFGLDAAEAVLDEVVGAANVAGIVRSLRDRSLLGTSARGTGLAARFTILRALRELLESEASSATFASARAAHADYFVTVAKREQPLLESPDDTSARRTLLAERPNLERALATAIDAGKGDAVAWIAAALGHVLAEEGPVTEALEAVERARTFLASRGSSDAATEGEVRLEIVCSLLLQFSGRVEESVGVATDAGALANALGNPELGALALERVGWGRVMSGAFLEAGTAFERAAREVEGTPWLWARMQLGAAYAKPRPEARALLRRVVGILGRERMVAAERISLSLLGAVEWNLGLLGDARVHLEEALDLLPRGEIPRADAVNEARLARVLHEEGAVDEACRLYESALRTFRELGNMVDVGTTCILLGTLLFEQGHVSRARTSVRDGLAVLEGIPDQRALARGLMMAAGVDIDRGDLEGARSRLEVAEAILGRTHAEDSWDLPLALGVRWAHYETQLATTSPDADATAARVAALALVEAVVHRRPDARPLEDPSLAPIEQSGAIRLASRHVLDLVEQACGRSSMIPTAVTTLVLAADASWFEVSGEPRQSLQRRGALRRILLALLGESQKGKRPLTVDDLFEVGWPRQQVAHASASMRVYSTVRTLRRIGLETAILRSDEGYYLNPAITLVVEE